MKNKLRKIVVNHQTFLWRREHFRLKEYSYSPCVEKVVVYLEGFKNSPLELHFQQEDNLTLKADVEAENWQVGYPSDGVIWYNSSAPNHPQIDINLNRPSVIAELIKYYIQRDWNPHESKKTMLVEDALKLLEIIDLPNGY